MKAEGRAQSVPRDEALPCKVTAARCVCSLIKGEERNGKIFLLVFLYIHIHCLQDSAADDSQSSDRPACRHADVPETNSRAAKNRKRKDKVGPLCRRNSFESTCRSSGRR